MVVRILEGDALTVLRTLPSESVQCVVTSPPYFALRDYGTARWEGGEWGCEHRGRDARVKSGGPGKQYTNVGSNAVYAGDCVCGARRVDGQLGLEKTPAEFIAALVAVFEEVRRVLRPDGLCFVNLGDSYSGSGKGPTGHNGIGDQIRRQGFDKSDTNRGSHKYSLLGGQPPAGIPAKNLLLIPERFAIAMQDAGWIVRSRICWAKTSAMPESVTDRPTSAWEHIYLFSKSPRYYWDQEAVRVPGAGSHPRGAVSFIAERKDNDRQLMETAAAGANLRNFWLLGPSPSSEAHFATFPPEIPRRCIKAGTSEKGACPACGAPWVRSNNREKRYNSRDGTALLVPKMPTGSAENGVRERPSEDGRAAPVVSGVRCSDQAGQLASGSEQDARTSQTISREECREDQRAKAPVPADRGGPSVDACGVEALRQDGQRSLGQTNASAAVLPDRAGKDQRQDAGQPSKGVAAGGDGYFHHAGLAADAEGSAQPMLLLQQSLHGEETTDDRSCDSVEQGRDAQPGEHRGSVPAVQLGQMESLDDADLGLDLSRPQSCRAVQLYRQSRLTPAHLEAIRAVGITDVGRGAATQTGTGKNTEEAQRLAAEAKQVLGGYYREFLLVRRTSNQWEPSCRCSPVQEPRPCVVLDPFLGSGTTALVADQLGRDAIGIDLSPTYCEMGRKRIAEDAPMLTQDAVTVEHAERQVPLLLEAT